MEVTDSIRRYVETKAAKLPKYYDGIQSIEVILDLDAEQSVAEIIVTGRKKHTFVATHRATDMYASVDQCLDKMTAQLRRHKEKVRDRKGPPRGEGAA
jgi:putative sigma-54 modulation protein